MRIFVAATHTATSQSRTGIQTVVHGLLRGLTKQGIDFQVVRWSAWRNALLPLDSASAERLGFRQNTELFPHGRLSGSWLLLPEVMYGSNQLRVIRYARKKRMRVAAIFYDAIPISHPELVRRMAARCHYDYMKALCDVDLVVPISDSAAEQFRLFVEKHRLGSPPICVCSLSGELVGQNRTVPHGNSSGLVNILCVSTLEPRKNLKTLFEAFDSAAATVSEPPLRLHLIGDRYKDADSILETVKAAVAGNRDVTWHGKVGEDQLVDSYRKCDFTVYPSFLEGFGLPILESLWHRRPCICADFGAMAETAKGGGCLNVDVRDPIKLGNAIVALATRPDLRQKLVDEIERRDIKTWAEYASELCRALETGRN